MFNSMKQKAMMLAGILFACARQFKMAALIAVLCFVGLTSKAHAVIGLTVSSTTNHTINNPVVAAVILARRGESITYIITSTAPLNPGTTASVEMSNNMSNWSTVYSTLTGQGGFSTGVTGIVPPVNSDTFFRWIIYSTVNAGSPMIPFTVTLRDNDDLVQVFKNNKNQDQFYFNDDSLNLFGFLKADRYQLQLSSGGSDIFISSGTQLQWYGPGTQDKVYPWSVTFSSYSQPIDKSFAVLRSTGGTGSGGFALTATPTISTQTATDGDIVVFSANTSSITFQNATATLPTALTLGAGSRSVGTGDILGLMYFRGFWHEIFFANNQEP